MSAGVLPDSDAPARPAEVGWWAVAGWAAVLAAGLAAAAALRALADPGGPAHGPVEVLPHVLATLAAVVALGQLLGRACRWVGQPAVIGEILAGIALGPSLLGAVWPGGPDLLIPGPTTDPGGKVAAALSAMAQLGVVLYMFLVGLELDTAALRGKLGTVLLVSQTGIALPFALGVLLAGFLYPALAGPAVRPTAFALFLGVSLSVTAFPVLARILADRGLDRTAVGQTALAAAAVGDVTAWCLLALVVGVARADVGQAALVAVWAGLFVAAMLLLVRPLAHRLSHRLDADPGPLPKAAVPVALVAVLAAALATEAIGVHAIFGAFLLGAVFPAGGRLGQLLDARLHDVVTVLLLPAFFALSGMRTAVGLVSGWDEWLTCGLIVLVATVGKVGGTVLAARLTGEGWRGAAALGALMNTRGLMELIVLNIGLELGVISPTLFAMMVLMALATTLMTGPALARILPAK